MYLENEGNKGLDGGSLCLRVCRVATYKECALGQHLRMLHTEYKPILLSLTLWKLTCGTFSMELLRSPVRYMLCYKAGDYYDKIFGKKITREMDGEKRTMLIDCEQRCTYVTNILLFGSRSSKPNLLLESGRNSKTQFSFFSFFLCSGNCISVNEGYWIRQFRRAPSFVVDLCLGLRCCCSADSIDTLNNLCPVLPLLCSLIVNELPVRLMGLHPDYADCCASFAISSRLNQIQHVDRDR